MLQESIDAVTLSRLYHFDILTIDFVSLSYLVDSVIKAEPRGVFPVSNHRGNWISGRYGEVSILQDLLHSLRLIWIDQNVTIRCEIISRRCYETNLG